MERKVVSRGQCLDMNEMAERICEGRMEIGGGIGKSVGELFGEGVLLFQRDLGINYKDITSIVFKSIFWVEGQKGGIGRFRIFRHQSS